MTRHSRRLLLLVLAVLAGGGTIPQRGAPAIVDAASASLNAVAGSAPASESRRPSDERLPQASATIGADNPALAAVLLRAARTAPLAEETAGAGALGRGRTIGGKLGVMSGALLEALDLTAATHGAAPVSPARQALCHAHGVRAGPLA